MEIHPYSLYLASWEHLHLIPGGKPAGLPNQLFARQPWALVLFEHLYCDLEGFLGEQNAFNVMGWTSSKLFCDLASRDILIPLRLRSALPVEKVSGTFRAEHGVSVEAAASADEPSIDEMLFAETRQHLLQPFLELHQLILYDWSLARLAGPLPEPIQQTTMDILEAHINQVPLARDVFTELPSYLAQVFLRLQDFEREPLRHLRSGRLSQPEYLERLRANIRQHREIDVFLAKGLPERFDGILKHRDRFGLRGGWKAVRELLAAHERQAPVSELSDLKRNLDEKLGYCFKPLASEYRPAIARITRTLARRLIPGLDDLEVTTDTGREMALLTCLFLEQLSYYRGDYRQGRRSD